MKLSLLLVIAFVSGLQTPAMCEDYSWTSRAYHPGRQFRLHAYWQEADMPLLAEPPRQAHPVDAALVTQIHQVRQELPNIHGTHIIVPGMSLP